VPVMRDSHSGHLVLKLIIGLVLFFSLCILSLLCVSVVILLLRIKSTTETQSSQSSQRSHGAFCPTCSSAGWE